MIKLALENDWNRFHYYPNLGWCDPDEEKNFSHYVCIVNDGFKCVFFVNGNSKQIKHELRLFLNHWRGWKGIELDIREMKNLVLDHPDFTRGE